jgi:putative transposase
VRDLAVLVLHLLATVARLAGPGGARSVVAESVLVKHQLKILNRSRKRSPNLRVSDRMVAGLCALLIRPRRLTRSAIVLKPFHALEPSSSADAAEVSAALLVQGADEVGPKGTHPGSHRSSHRYETAESDLGLSSDRSTNRLGLRHCHQQGCGAAHSRRSVPAGTRLGWAVLAHRPRSHEGQSLESRSVSMRVSHPAHTRGARRDGPWTRRIVGFGVHRGVVDGVDLCRMFNRATRGQSSPKYLSSDHDSPYRFHQWQANLRILDVRAIKTVPYVPLSHPFVERLIGTIRRECLDRTLFWTAVDLEMKLLDFQRYYNGHRTHAGLDGRTPEPSTDPGCARASVSSYRWQPHCRGLYQTPMAA